MHTVNSFCPAPYPDCFFNKLYDIEFTSSHLCMLSKWLYEKVIAVFQASRWKSPQKLVFPLQMLQYSVGVVSVHVPTMTCLKGAT